MAGRFIKIYVEDFWRLCNEHNLTRAEIGQLVMLSMYVNAKGQSRPGNQEQARRIGLNTRQGAYRLNKRLREKSVISWEHSTTYQSNVYTLPNCFKYGSLDNTGENASKEATYSEGGGVYNSTQGGVHNSTQGDVNNSTQGGVYNSTHRTRIGIEQESKEQEKNKQTESSPERVGGDSLALRDQLIQKGVTERDAELIVEQYNHAMIRRTLRETKLKTANNPGAYLRTIIERKGGEPLKYKNATRPEQSEAQDPPIPPVAAPPPALTWADLADDYAEDRHEPARREAPCVDGKYQTLWDQAVSAVILVHGKQGAVVLNRLRLVAGEDHTLVIQGPSHDVERIAASNLLQFMESQVNFGRTQPYRILIESEE